MVNSLPLLLAATTAALTACSTRKAEPASKSPPSTQTRPAGKITPSPWQPPAEVDPPHRDPGDRVEPVTPPAKPAPKPTS